MSSEVSKSNRFTTDDPSLSDLQTLHVELAKTSSVANYLVYGQPAFRSYLRDVVDHPDHLFTRVPSEEGIGFCHLRNFDGCILLNNIYVAPNSRAQGLGRRLLRDSIAAFAPLGGERMQLDVFESNLPAVGWYQRLGFEYHSRALWTQYTVPTSSRSRDDMMLRTDAYGFLQLFVGSELIGTQLGNVMVLTSNKYLPDVGADIARYVVTRTSEPCRPGGTVLESSIRMKAVVSKVQGKLADASR